MCNNHRHDHNIENMILNNICLCEYMYMYGVYIYIYISYISAATHDIPTIQVYSDTYESQS